MPDSDWISVVSVVRRDSTSPVLVTSKNAGSMRITRWYTALRRSATTRSPIQFTRYMRKLANAANTAAATSSSRK